MMTTKFWAGTAERAIKTFAQALVTVIGTGQVGVTELDWAQMLSVAATAAILSVLTSVGSAGLTGEDTPDLTKPAFDPPANPSSDWEQRHDGRDM